MYDVSEKDTETRLVPRVVISLKGGWLIRNLPRRRWRHQFTGQLPMDLLRDRRTTASSSATTPAKSSHRSVPFPGIPGNVTRYRPASCPSPSVRAIVMVLLFTLPRKTLFPRRP